MHRFWRENTHILATHEGRENMINELDQYDTEFTELAKDIGKALNSFFDRLGLSSEEVDREVGQWLLDAGLFE
jgi:hypothetical protein